MPLVDLLTGSGLGSLLGVRHALEPDHLAAVSTLVTQERSGYRAAWLGACWGFGHTIALLIVGGALIAMRAELPVRVAALFEVGVAIMLIGLGARAILHALRTGSEGPVSSHRHRFVVHQHAGAPAHVHIGSWTFAQRPLLIGAVHGLAGSGALTALVVTTLPSPGAQFAYMMLFGLGSTVGMAALSGILGWPLARLSTRQSLARAMSLIVGAVSLGIGLIWGYPLLTQLL